MIQHFNFKPLFENSQLPGWAISFFYQRERFTAEYLRMAISNGLDLFHQTKKMLKK